MKKWLLFGVQITVTLLLLWVIFRREGFGRDLLTLVTTAHIGYLLAALLAALGVQCLTWVRWWVCLRILGLSVPFWRSFRFCSIGLFASLFLMGPLGGDAIRIGLLWRDEYPKSLAAMSVLLDRLSGMGALILAAFAFTAFRHEWFMQDPLAARMLHALWIALGVASFAVLFTFVISRMGWIHFLPAWAPFREQVITCTGAWDRFSRHPRLALFTVLLSCVAILLYFLVFSLCSAAFHLGIAWLDIYSVLPVVDAAAALPISFAGLGLREKLFEVMLARLAGASPAAGVSVSLGAFLAMSFWCAAGALCIPGYRSKKGVHVTLGELGRDS